MIPRKRTVAIVGTRSPSPDARFITLQLAMQLARADYAVVSGLALGIDAAAHTGALSAAGRRVTIAVLGSGVLKVYPPANRELAERIREVGRAGERAASLRRRQCAAPGLAQSHHQRLEPGGDRRRVR